MLRIILIFLSNEEYFGIIIFLFAFSGLLAVTVELAFAENCASLLGNITCISHFPTFCVSLLLSHQF